MFLGEALDFSVKALKANPVRSFLTGLGMVIGTASVILVVTISLTSREYILEQIEGVGSNMVFAYYEAGNQSATQADADFVKMADVDAVRERLADRIVAATGISTNFDRTGPRRNAAIRLSRPFKLRRIASSGAADRAQLIAAQIVNSPNVVTITTAQ